MGEMLTKKVLIVSTDNNAAAGAFRSMVKLCELIKENGKYFPVVILPKKGDGSRLLDEIGIQYYYVRSFNWVQDISENGTFIGKIKISVKRLLNISAVYRIGRSII